MQDLKRFGRIVRERREELGIQQEDMGDHGGPSSTTMSRIENGLGMPSAKTLRKLDTGLRWQPGSAKTALNGEDDPTPLPKQQDSTASFVASNREQILEQPYIHLFALLWTNSRDLGRLLLESHQSADVLRQTARLLAITVDVASDLLVASPDAAHSKPLLQQMFEEFYDLRNIITEREEKADVLEATTEPAASAQGKAQAGSVVRGAVDDTQQRPIADILDTEPGDEDAGVDGGEDGEGRKNLGGQ